MLRRDQIDRLSYPLVGCDAGAAQVLEPPQHVGQLLDSRGPPEALAVGLGLSSYVSLGRRGDVSANDLLQFWQDDAQTRAIALVIGAIGNPRKLERIAGRLTALKPVLEDAALAKLGHQLKFDTHILANHGVGLAGYRSWPL